MMSHAVHKLPRIGISAARRLFGLSARALRHYEERGLIEARRDRNNIRYYDAKTLDRLAWIARLRRADVPLTDVKEFLNAPIEARTELALEMFGRRRERSLTELAAIDAAISALSAPGAVVQQNRQWSPTAMLPGSDLANSAALGAGANLSRARSDGPAARSSPDVSSGFAGNRGEPRAGRWGDG